MTKHYIVTWPGPLNKRYLMNEARLHETQWPQHAEIYDRKSDALTVVARLKRRGFDQKFNVEVSPWPSISS